MDEFRRIAGAYFQALEGWKLYPSFRTWHWYVWAASLVALIGTLLAVARVSDPGTAATAALLVAEAAYAGVWLWIDAFKRASVLQAASIAFGAVFDSIDEVRRARLERLTGTCASKFLDVANECDGLLRMEREHRLLRKRDGEFYFRKIYDPDSKARLLTIFMGAVALFTALMVRSLPADYPTIVELLADKGVWTIVVLLMFVVAMVFGLGLALHAMISSAAAVARMWWTEVTGGNQSGPIAIRYLLSDLVRLHRPSSLLADVKASKLSQEIRLHLD